MRLVRPSRKNWTNGSVTYVRVKSKFKYSISDCAIFLGKAGVTLRSWERKGEYTFPRHGSDRQLDSQQMRELARWARSAGRISEDRLRRVEAALTMMEIVEDE